MNPAPAPLPPKKDPPAVKKDDAERELPQRPEPLDDPDAEYARLMILGKEAFAQQQYGRAAQRFRQGIALRGRKSEGYILLTQALLAQGKYHEANDAIRAGLIRDPRHPLADFRPIELYRDSPAAYAEHLEVLEEAVERHPMDAELSFVYAYVLWFDGRREQAGRWFARAAQADFLFSASEEFLKQLRSSEEL
jgi:tetratricopeptide (TPR) repeat protein